MKLAREYRSILKLLFKRTADTQRQREIRVMDKYHWDKIYLSPYPTYLCNSPANSHLVYGFLLCFGTEFQFCKRKSSGADDGSTAT